MAWKIAMRSGGEPVVWTNGPFEIRAVGAPFGSRLRHRHRLFRRGKTVGTYDALDDAKAAARKAAGKRRNMARRRNQGRSLLTIGLLGAGAYAAWRFLFRKPTMGPIPTPTPTPPGPTPVPKPPVPPPNAPPQEIVFEADGDTQLTLPGGAEFVVTWDPSQPWGFVAEDTETTQAIDTGDGWVRFREVTQMPTGGVDQVYVQAVDENDEVVAEHKFTIFGP